jgi:phosphoglycerate dehydrogenase-like enzyme
MTADPPRPRVGVACHPRLRPGYLAAADVARLEQVADLVLGDFEVAHSSWGTAPADPGAEQRLAAMAADLDVLVVCHGSPRVTDAVLADAPRLRIVGDLEGDRFWGRIDTAAARRRGIAVVDTSHGSSYPVAEWALALAMLGLRGAVPAFRSLIAGAETERPPAEEIRELTGRTVGLIGFGHIAWRLVELLRPFDVSVIATDPYAPRELADALDITFAGLDHVLGSADVVICLAPLTSSTTGMLGAAELARLRPGTVFVNVSRGAIVDSAALRDRLQVGDIVGCLDVYDPEPFPVDDPVRRMPNVFLSPHLAGTTIESRSRFFRLMVDEVLRVVAGAEPRSVITDRVLAGRAHTSDGMPA